MKPMVAVIALCISLLSCGRISAQELPRLFIEADPTTFVLRGYGVHLRTRAIDDHWLLGIGTYGFDIPSLLVNLAPGNRDEQWMARISNTTSAYAEYFFKVANKGFFIGEQLGFQRWKFTNDLIPGSTSTNSIIAMTYAGFTYYLFGSRFYIKPWGGIGLMRNSRTPVLGDKAYQFPTVMPLITFHLGYALH